jgi:hypothetical protein
VRLVPLHEVKININDGFRARAHKIQMGALHVLTIPGVKNK